MEWTIRMDGRNSIQTNKTVQELPSLSLIVW